MTAPPKAPTRGRGNLLSLGINQVVRLTAGLAINVMLMRGLGVDGFGIYGYIMTLVGVLAFGSHLGLEPLLNRDIARQPELLGKRVATGLVAVLVASLLTSLIVIAWAWLLDGRTIVIAASGLAAITLTLHSLGLVPSAAFHGVRRMNLTVPGRLASRISAVVVLAVLLWRGGDVLSAFTAQVVGELLGLIVIGFIFWRAFGAVPWSEARGEVPTLVRRSVPFAVGSLFSIVYLSVDVILLGLLTTDTEVGVYRGASMLISLLVVVAHTLNTGLFPRMARHLGDRVAAGAELRFSARVLLAVGIPAAVGGMMLAEPLMVLFGGQDFAVSAACFIILAPLLPLRFLNNGFGMTLAALDRQPDRARGAMLAAVFNIAANLVAIPMFGALGAAGTTLLTEILLASWLGWRVAPLVTGLRLWGLLLRAALPAVLMAALLWLLPPVHVLLAVTAGALAYGVGAVLTGAIKRSDLGRLRGV